jgi:hypothetical protein
MGACLSGSVTTRKLVGDIVQVVSGNRLSELSGNAIGQRVAADTGEVLAQKVSRPYGVACSGQADDFDVMALPVHLASTSPQDQCSRDGAEIGKSELECWVCGNGEAQCDNGSAAVHGSLRLPVPRRRLPVGGHGAAVVLSGRSGARLISKVYQVMTAGVLHGSQVEPAG